MQTVSLAAAVLALALGVVVEGDIILYQNAYNPPEREFESVEARFGPDIPDPGLDGLLYQADPLNGCTPLKNPVNDTTMANRSIVYMRRDDCKFVEKVLNAQLAGYSAVIIFDNENQDLIQMSGDGTEITIPSVFVQERTGAELLSAAEKTPVTLTPDMFPEWPQYLTTMAASAACGVLLFAMFVVYRRQHHYQQQSRSRMTPQQAMKLETRKATAEEEEDQCCICLENYEANETLTELPCRHFFHKKCITPWLMERDRVCPICKRDPVTTERTPLCQPDAVEEGQATVVADGASINASESDVAALLVEEADEAATSSTA